MTTLALAPLTAAADPQLRIINGREAAPGEFPWQVALVLASAPADNLYDHLFCGGSLIHPRWVVTAAHCVAGVTSPANVDVMAGLHRLDQTETAQRLEVERIIVHGGFGATGTPDDDIALLELAGEAACTDCGSIGLVSPADEAALVVPGSTVATVTGWGDTNADRAVEELSYTLQKTELDIVDRESCRDMYQALGYARSVITDNMLCAYRYTYDSCQGDSGGPLMIPTTDGTGTLRLAGIVSWGDSCAAEDSPGIYTRVANYSDWIGTKTGGVVGSAPPSGGGGGGGGISLPVSFSLLVLAGWRLRRRRD